MDEITNSELQNDNYKFEITMHEIPKYIQNVTVSGEKQKWSRGRFNHTLEAAGVLDLSVAIDAAEFD